VSLAARSLVRLTVLPLFALASVSACAHHRAPPADGVAAGDYAAADDLDAQPVVLEFENNNWADVVLYIVHDGQTSRLLLVTATHTGEVGIPPHLQGQGGLFRIIVKRVGGRDMYTSDPISLRTGHTVHLTIESDIARSSIGVW
jgi:hypothetical protein